MASDDQWLVVGLGNPGPDYAGNRHNVGQMVLAEMAHRLSAGFKNHRTHSSVAEGRLVPGGPRFVLAKPATYMNVSGGPVQSLLRLYDLDVSRLIVVHDELDIDFDTIKLKHGGGHGGHNGLRDIIAATGSNEFTRVRVGIGRPPGRQPAADFVLKDFSATERQNLPILLADAADAIEMIAADGLTAAQLKFHTASS
ncbi:aminoacyl-tRNA hydrolase [Frigoribacterium faeni]|uniref:Peptidyl-tRNA hydrolase n=1 Tax=Frigoribacterium faeni TaxID=145483 RepID=A0A7W3JIS0_9MICO|nr:aminoacyl-tRNA hydrolase [Frigoribacterium faeni]MBA8813565.1 PTH1 family peptidyl-tRNA hydrolase [Frigoribacterium faeni]BFF14832.1 aminoacyl-tRNA hydrolase [Microbacterium flavescens]GEK84337.1 peptidyl-tRNA hydrolase [Frigoribacterium faeni]